MVTGEEGARQRQRQRDREAVQNNENIRNEKCVEEKRIKIGSLGCMHRVISIAIHEKQKEKREKNSK